MALTLLPVPSAISSILGTWLDQYSEDFCQPPDFPCLKQLVAYVQLNMPGSDLERRAHLLLAQLEDLEPSEVEPEGEEPGAATQSLAERVNINSHHKEAPMLALGQEQGARRQYTVVWDNILSRG